MESIWLYASMLRISMCRMKTHKKSQHSENGWVKRTGSQWYCMGEKFMTILGWSLITHLKERWWSTWWTISRTFGLPRRDYRHKSFPILRSPFWSSGSNLIQTSTQRTSTSVPPCHHTTTVSECQGTQGYTASRGIPESNLPTKTSGEKWNASKDISRECYTCH